MPLLLWPRACLDIPYRPPGGGGGGLSGGRNRKGLKLKKKLELLMHPEPLPKVPEFDALKTPAVKPSVREDYDEDDDIIFMWFL